MKVDGTVYTGSCGYSSGTTITLQAMPLGQYKFKQWGGALTGSANPTTLTMNTSKSVTAYFVLKTESVNLQGAKSLLDGGGDVLVLDVSTAAEYAAGHLLCAKNYVWNSGAGNFSTSIANLTPYKNDDILIYDQTGAKSAAAADYLAGQGFNFVYYMSDGLIDWMAEGYETFTTAEDGNICTSLAPLAYAGADQSVNENAAVTLRGQGWAPDGGAVAYAWTQAQGSNTVTLSNAAAAQPVFTAPNLNGSDDTLVFHLTVTDSGGKKDTDSVTVHVNWVNGPPTANAGPDQTVTPGTLVTLNGSGSTDPENSIVSYQWIVDGGSLNPTLANASTVSPSFTASATGWVFFKLTVTDNGGLTSRDTVKVTVAAGSNTPPVADAGNNQTVTEGAAVTLDSSGSTDADGTIASREWTQTSGPSVTLSPNKFAVKPTFTAPNVNASTALNFSLKVTDDDGATGTDTVTITVNDSGGTPGDPPAAPTGVAATDGTPTDKVRVTWRASTGADSYDVYRADMPAWAGASPARIASSVTGLSYDDASAAAGSQYYYWVKARNSGGVSAFSMFDTGYRGGKGAAPKAPTGVDAEDGGSGKVAINWNASASALVYEVYRGTIPAYLGGKLTKIATVSATTYDDGSAASGSQYYYWVKARNSWGVSPYSAFDEGYAGTASSPPPAPLGVTASDGMVGKVAITWQSSSGAVLYEIWRATKLVADGGKPTRIGYVSGFSFDDTTGVGGVTYYYWVKARSSWGSSGYSAYDTGFRD